MPHLTVASQPFSVATQIQEGVKSWSTLDRVKNVLTGRVFTNWREQLLGGVTVLYVIKAALSFFGAAFLPALFQFSMAAFMAILRKEIADFTNLHNATKDYRDQNMRHALNNLELRENVRQFKEEIHSLRREAARFQASNDEYARNNQVHSKLLDNLEATTDELARELRQAMESGNAVSGRILQGFLQGVERMQEQKQLLKGVQHALREEHLEQLDQLERILSQVKSAEDHQIRAVTEANEELRRSRAALEEIREDLAEMGGQATALKEEIGHLQQVRRDLQEDVKQLRRAREEIDTAVGTLGTAARRNVETSNMVAGAFKALFFAADENGDQELSLNKMFYVGAVGIAVGLAWRSAFPSSDVPNMAPLSRIAVNGLRG